MDAAEADLCFRRSFPSDNFWNLYQLQKNLFWHSEQIQKGPQDFWVDSLK